MFLRTERSKFEHSIRGKDRLPTELTLFSNRIFQIKIKIKIPVRNKDATKRLLNSTHRYRSSNSTQSIGHGGPDVRRSIRFQRHANDVSDVHTTTNFGVR